MALKWITGLLLSTLLLCVPHCEWNECGHVTLNSSLHFGCAKPSQHTPVKTSIRTLKYLGTHIWYYSNSTATFQIPLTVYGDKEPNPGPHPKISNCDRQRRPRFHLWKTSDDNEEPTACRLGLNVYYSHFNDHPSSCPSFYHASQSFRLDYDVWKRIHELGISRKRKTHRGTKGRRRSKNTDTNLQTLPPLIRERKVTYRRIQQINHNNLKPVNLLKPNDYDLPRLFFSNVRSISNKIDEIEVVANDKKVDLIALTETWADENTSPDFLSINGFMLFSKPRIGRRGGGVALHASECLNPHNITPINGT